MLVVGVVLLVLGMEANRSLGSGISRLFTGAPTDKSVFLLVGGALAFIAGLAGLSRGDR
jgi:hypothetical protein